MLSYGCTVERPTWDVHAAEFWIDSLDCSRVVTQFIGCAVKAVVQATSMNTWTNIFTASDHQMTKIWWVVIAACHIAGSSHCDMWRPLVQTSSADCRWRRQGSVTSQRNHVHRLRDVDDVTTRRLYSPFVCGWFLDRNWSQIVTHLVLLIGTTSSKAYAASFQIGSRWNLVRLFFKSI